MVLSQVSESEIPALLKNLDLESCDVLMKYVYKLMGKSSNCAIMLKIHAQLVEKAGLGSIVRVMTDRKQV
ncbi:actin-related protein 2/3 complex subunit 5 [Ochromonadaceae sp. CCMP2298]|nr:actin-related protein 2/3 complex subunit 5 [Ochromonadaceae sp. CCMP2298]